MCVQGTVTKTMPQVGGILNDSNPFTDISYNCLGNPLGCAGKVLSSLVCIWETRGSEWLLPGITQDSTSYLIVNFKFLYHPQLHEHPKSSCDHGIYVERKVIKMYVINGKF